MLLIAFTIFTAFHETDTHSTLEFGTACVTGHNHHGILEVHRATLTIGQAAIVHDLQQCVEDLWMRLLNLVQQDHAVRATTHLLGQLTTLVIANVAGRATKQTRNGMRLHVLRHIQSDQVILTAKKFSGQRLRQFRLTYARWT